MSQSPNALEATRRFDAETADFVVTVLHEDGEYRHLRFQTPGQLWGSTDIHTWPGGLTTFGDMADGFAFERGLNFFGGERGPNLHYWAEKLTPRLRNEHMEFSKAILRQTLADVPEDFDIPEEYRPALTVELNEIADRIVDEYGSVEAAQEELREFSFEYEDEAGTSRTLRFEEYYDMAIEDYTFQYAWACLVLNTVVNLMDANSSRVVRPARVVEQPQFSF